jgi:MFS family permease
MAGSQMFRSLRSRNARWFFAGLALSNIGTWLQLTAMSLLVFRLTGRATDVGINLLCQFTPMLVLGAWAGVVADRVSKQKMALITQSSLAGQALLLGVLELNDLVSLPVVYLLSTLLGIINAMDNPARRGFVIELVEPSDISNALALNTAVMTGSRIFGPALAAMLIEPLGSGWLFVINGVSFAAIIIPIARIRPEQLHVSPPAARGGTPIRDALRFMRNDARLRNMLILFSIISTFAFNYSVSLLKLADQRWGNEAYFGWVLGITSIGSLAGSLAAAARPRMTAGYFLGSCTLLGFSGLAVAWSPNVVVAALAGIPLGFGGAGMISAFNGVTQHESPPDMRGRLLALGAVAFLGSTPIGAPITGVIADRIGAEWSLAYGSIIALVCVAFGWRARSRRLAVPAHQHEPVAPSIHDADGRGFVVESGS